MTENKRSETSATLHHSGQKNNNVTVLRIPKPNLQIVILGLIAVITLFQTFQLIRINLKASSASVKAAPATTTINNGTGTGSNADVPKSMVGGC